MQTHEEKVAHFYESGITNCIGPHDVNENSLCFGLWYPWMKTYGEAARALVVRMGSELGLDRSSALLDAGCGMGYQDCILAAEFHPRLIQGVDITPKHIELARLLVEREQKLMRVPSETTIRFHCGSATELPYASETFSHVLALESAPHMNTREDFFREAYRVLKPGGVLACADFILARYPEDMFERLLVALGSRAWHMPRANVYDYFALQFRIQMARFEHFAIDLIGKDVIPGYYAWHRRPEQIQAMRKLRGTLKGVYGGAIIDRVVLDAYRHGLCEYAIYSAHKPCVTIH